MELVGVVQSIDYLTRNLRRFMRCERRHVDLFYRSGRAYVHYQPKGVIGVMAPWNYPISLTLIPLATALAAGNRAMLKPSELTPRTSELMQRMLASVFPAEEVAVVLAVLVQGGVVAGEAVDGAVVGDPDEQGAAFAAVGEGGDGLDDRGLQDGHLLPRGG